MLCLPKNNKKQRAIVATAFVIWTFGTLLFAQTVPVPPRKLDALSKVPTPPVPNLSIYVKSQAAAIQLGKALFWDMNIGGDGKQACATCHFNGGADSRAVNQVSPGLKAGDTTFQLGGPNYQLLFIDFPIPKAINDVISSAGVHAGRFSSVTPGSSADTFTPVNPDPDGFNMTNVNGGVSITRKVEPRNTPTTINAVFNFRNFWDGRAQNDCNFLNPFGKRDQDPTHHLYVAGTQTIGGVVTQKLTATKPTVSNGSLCSQALGPALSPFEMSAGGRTFLDLGKKMLSSQSLKPLSQQVVSPQDSRLGLLSAFPVMGLYPTYLTMIQNAFQSRWWNPQLNVCVLPGPPVTETTIDTSVAGAACPQGATQYTLAQYNFSLFWGLSVQLYEATLRADQSKLDKFLLAADATSSTAVIGFGDGSSVSFGGALQTPVLFASVDIHAGPLAGRDDGNGNVISDTRAVAGTLNYSTGAITLNFTTPPALNDPITITSQKIPNNIFTPQEIQGFAVFQGKGKCAACHSGPEMTNAAVQTVANQPLERMLFPNSGLIKVYDNGFYNTGVRQTLEDISLGANDPFGTPLSMTELERQQVCANPNLIINVPPRPNENIAGAPLSCSDLVNRNGSFKSSTIRNVELTAPYFHNGGQMTLLQVVDFYNRAGDFAAENQQDLDPNIEMLGLTPAEEQALVAFMLTTTDQRLKYQKSPFDHPSLMISNGAPTAPDASGRPAVLDDNTGQATDNFITIPAVGSGGAAKPLCSFAENVAGVRADASGPCP